MVILHSSHHVLCSLLEEWFNLYHYGWTNMSRFNLELPWTASDTLSISIELKGIIMTKINYWTAVRVDFSPSEGEAHKGAGRALSCSTRGRLHSTQTRRAGQACDRNQSQPAAQWQPKISVAYLSTGWYWLHHTLTTSSEVGVAELVDALRALT